MRRTGTHGIEKRSQDGGTSRRDGAASNRERLNTSSTYGASVADASANYGRRRVRTAADLSDPSRFSLKTGRKAVPLVEVIGHRCSTSHGRTCRRLTDAAPSSPRFFVSPLRRSRFIGETIKRKGIAIENSTGDTPGHPSNRNTFNLVKLKRPRHNRDVNKRKAPPSLATTRGLCSSCHN